MASIGWTWANTRHAATLFRRGSNPAATVYESLGPNFFLALDDGWLNLGLWDGDGTNDAEAPHAGCRLVSVLARPLPEGGVVLDVGNGLGVQDLVIADAVNPERLVALNISASQLHAGRHRLAQAGALAVNADAVRIPLRDESVDGVISVEAAFHFSFRDRFFTEAFRVLRPGGVVTMSDIPVNRLPRTPTELLAGLIQLRVWGLPFRAAVPVDGIVDAMEASGFRGVRAELVGERVIGPALTFVRGRLDRCGGEVPPAMRLACRAMLAQAELLWRNRVIDYVLLTAFKPARRRAAPATAS